MVSLTSTPCNVVFCFSKGKERVNRERDARDNNTQMEFLHRALRGPNDAPPVADDKVRVFGASSLAVLVLVVSELSLILDSERRSGWGFLASMLALAILGVFVSISLQFAMKLLLIPWTLTQFLLQASLMWAAATFGADGQGSMFLLASCILPAQSLIVLRSSRQTAMRAALGLQGLFMLGIVGVIVVHASDATKVQPLGPVQFWVVAAFIFLSVGFLTVVFATHVREQTIATDTTHETQRLLEERLAIALELVRRPTSTIQQLAATERPPHPAVLVAANLIQSAVDDVESVVGYHVSYLHFRSIELRPFLADCVRAVENVADEQLLAAKHSTVVPVSMKGLADHKKGKSRGHFANASGPLLFSVAIDDAAPVNIYTDPRRLSEAIKEVTFSAAQRARTRVRLTAQFKAEGPTLEIQVRDDGPSLTPKERKLLLYGNEDEEEGENDATNRTKKRHKRQVRSHHVEQGIHSVLDSTVTRNSTQRGVPRCRMFLRTMNGNLELISPLEDIRNATTSSWNASSSPTMKQRSIAGNIVRISLKLEAPPKLPETVQSELDDVMEIAMETRRASQKESAFAAERKAMNPLPFVDETNYRRSGGRSAIHETADLSLHQPLIDRLPPRPSVSFQEPEEFLKTHRNPEVAEAEDFDDYIEQLKKGPPKVEIVAKTRPKLPTSDELLSMHLPPVMSAEERDAEVDHDEYTDLSNRANAIAERHRRFREEEAGGGGGGSASGVGGMQTPTRQAKSSVALPPPVTFASPMRANANPASVLFSPSSNRAGAPEKLTDAWWRQRRWGQERMMGTDLPDGAPLEAPFWPPKPLDVKDSRLVDPVLQLAREEYAEVLAAKERKRQQMHQSLQSQQPSSSFVRQERDSSPPAAAVKEKINATTTTTARSNSSSSGGAEGTRNVVAVVGPPRRRRPSSPPPPNDSSSNDTDDGGDRIDPDL